MSVKSRRRPGSGNVLSHGAGGRVYLCPEGCVHVDLRAMSLRLTKAEFRSLVELLTSAADELSPPAAPTVH